MSFRIVATGSLALAFVASLVGACSSKGALGAAGATCEVVSDCQPGLVCVPQKTGAGQCSSNLGSIQQLPGTPDAGKAATTDASSAEDGSTVVSDDSGGGNPPVTDTGAPPEKDTGAPPEKDTGAPVQDTGAPVEDTGAPPDTDAATD